MIINISPDFPVTTISNSVNITPKKRNVITARTRAGKTTLVCYLAVSYALENPESLVLIIGPNLTSFCEDVLDKFEGVDQLAKYTDLVEINSLRERRSFETILKHLLGVERDQPLVTVVNADHTYVKKVLDLVRVTNKDVVVFLDEAHKAGPKTYDALKDTLRPLEHVSLIETTATFRSNLLTMPMAEVHVLISRAGKYVDPTAAKLIPVDRDTNNKCVNMREPYLDNLYLDNLYSFWETESQSLSLVSGNARIGFHKMCHDRILDMALEEGIKVAIITINNRKARYVGSDDPSVTHEITHTGTQKPIRAASAIIAAVYPKGYNHIVVVGHKMVEMGQTIGCSELPLDLHILFVSKSRPKAHNIAQWIRTGGNGVGAQSIICPREIWEDYQQYVQVNEDLALKFSGLSPEQQVKVAEEEFLELEHKSMTVENGDFSVTSVFNKEKADKLPTITWYFETECPDDYRELFNYVEDGPKRETRDLRVYINQLVAKKVEEEDFVNPVKNTIRTLAGDINTTKNGRGGNDVQVYVNADPTAESLQSWQRNITVWFRPEDEKMCIRVRPNLEPQIGKTHDYWGKERVFVKEIYEDKLVLQN